MKILIRITLLCLSLTALPAPASPRPKAEAPMPVGDARILAARSAVQNGDRVRLERLAAAREPHVLNMYVEYWLLMNKLARREPPDEAEIAAFIAREPEAWLAERLRGDWLRRLAREERWERYLQVFAELRRPDQELSCHAWTARLQLGDASALDEAARQFVTLSEAREACEPVLQRVLLAGRVDQESFWQRFRRQVDAKNPAAARNTLAWLPDQGPLLAMQLDRVLANPAAYLSQTTADASRGQRELLLAALARLAREDVDSALGQLHRLSEALSPAEVAYGWAILAHRAAERHRPEAADWYRRAGAVTMDEEQRAWRIRAGLRSGDWELVRFGIEQLPDSERRQPEWIYWLARAQIVAGQHDAANALYAQIAGQPHFYGLLAAEELGRRFEWPATRSTVGAAERALVERDPGLRRALALHRLDMRLDAIREWNWALRDRSDGFLVAAARLALEQGIYDRAINTAERSDPQAAFDLRYLAPYREVVEPKARERGLDVGWVYGILRQESRFVISANSSAGAQGLMQVMPATGKWVAQKVGLRDYHPGWLTQLDRNVLLGTHYMNLILEELDNHPVLASAGYNAGPGRARRWRDTQPLEGAIYTETIPFDETRDYVKKVLANTVIYAALFDNRPQSLKARLGMIGPKS